MKPMNFPARPLVAAMLAFGLMATANAGSQAAAAAPQPAAQHTEQSTREQVSGWQLMTPEERLEMQARMRSATTAEERTRIRAEHHQQMQARAMERGVELSDGPRGRERGNAQGQGMGNGEGAGAGKGPGR
ncbi:MAG: hypothetical protein RIC56_17935 [Pseudomonadales bacterium]